MREITSFIVEVVAPVVLLAIIVILFFWGFLSVVICDDECAMAGMKAQYSQCVAEGIATEYCSEMASSAY